MNADFKINGVVIETERLILRQFEEGDLNDFYEYASVEGVGEMAGWKHHEAIEKTQEILSLFIEENKTFAIVLKESNKVIGSLGVERYGREEALTEFNGYIGREIGYVLSKDHWGKGLMPEAVGAVIDYLFNTLNFDFLTCGYFDFNNQSKRVQEKCGFKPYRKLLMDTRMGTSEPGVLNLLINPKKNITLIFSHPETLIYDKGGTQERHNDKGDINMKNENNTEEQVMYMPIGMCLGVSIGAAIGAATGNIGVFMCLGIGLGMCIGSLIDAHIKRKADAEADDTSTDVTEKSSDTDKAEDQ